jgi:KDO2-lipid IV(A) lauroyltransferase
MRLKRIRKRAEYLLLRAALRVVPYLPRRLAVFFGRGLGRIAYHLAGSLRRIGLANLELALPEIPDARARARILQESFATFGLLFFDILWFTRRSRERMARYVEIDPSVNGYFSPRAQVCVTAHLGNWEMLGHASAGKGYPLVSVAAPLVNPLVDTVLEQVRQMMGQRVVSRDGAIRVLLKTLRDNGKVGLVLDQNTKPEEGGVFVPFFGRPVPISMAAATLAIRTGASICFGFCVPRPGGRYFIHTPAPEIDPRPYPLTPDGIRDLTARIAGVLEQAIRRHPGHWLWMYKRWKYFPPGADVAAYPFYARPLPPPRKRKPKT